MQYSSQSKKWDRGYDSVARIRVSTVRGYVRCASGDVISCINDEDDWWGCFRGEKALISESIVPCFYIDDYHIDQYHEPGMHTFCYASPREVQNSYRCCLQDCCNEGAINFLIWALMEESQPGEVDRKEGNDTLGKWLCSVRTTPVVQARRVLLR